MTEELPEGWVHVALEAVLSHTIGGVWGKQAGEDELDARVLRVTEFGENTLLNPETGVIRSVTKRQLSARQMETGDLLLEKSGGGPNKPVGRVVLVRSEPTEVAVPTNFVQLLRPNMEVVLPSFLAWQLDWWHKSGVAESLQRATTNIRNLQTKAYLGHRLVLPPRTEQERIAMAIEEHLSRLDAAEAALEGANRRLNSLLTSTLISVCSGSWATAPLSEVVHSVKNGVFVSRPGVDPPGHPIFRISAVRPLVLHTDDVRYAEPVPAKAENYRVEVGDVLFTRYSGNADYVGAAAVVPADGAGVLHPDKLIRVITDTDRVLPEWLAAYVAAGEGRKEIEKRLKTTAGQVGISGSQLKTVPIATPPLEYQRRAVAHLQTLQHQRDLAARELATATSRSASLRRSILSAAFSGQLVPQDPGDEPASVLLKRIAAEQPVKKPPKKKAS